MVEVVAMVAHTPTTLVVRRAVEALIGGPTRFHQPLTAIF